jgi:predicted dehydrogenase
LDQLLKNEKVQAVFVCSPNHAHKGQVVEAAAARKHVLCEKPLAVTSGDCRAMIRACRDAGVRLAVAFNLRHNPAHIATRDIVRNGILGTVRMAEVQYMHVTSGAAAARPSPTWRRDLKLAGGGSFIATGVHGVDLLRFVLHKEVTQLSAVADEEWHKSGIERLIQVSLLLEGGVIAHLSAGGMNYPQNHLVLYGAQATLRCTDSIGNYGGGSIEVISDQGRETTEFEVCDVYAREVDAFVRGLNSADDLSATGEDGHEAARVAEAVYASLKTQAAVKVS